MFRGLPSVAISVASMNFEKRFRDFTSEIVHPPAPEVVAPFDVAAKVELVGRDKVLEVLLKTCPKSAKPYLKDLV